MKAAVAAPPRNVTLEEMEIPHVSDGDILVEMKACGVCGTDLEKVQGVALTPPVLGHEVAGRVEDVGDGVTGLKKGDRVFVHHHVSCGSCYYCLNDSPTMCEQFLSSNLDPCGFAEYFRVPEPNVVRGGFLKLPQNVDYEDAALIEPAACCLRNLSRLRVKATSHVAVLGCGAIGQIHIKLLRKIGVAGILASDPIDYRLRVAEKNGAHVVTNPLRDDIARSVESFTGGRGADVAIVATPNREAQADALRIVRKGGVVNIFGAPHRGAEITLDLGKLFIREISIIPTYSTSDNETKSVLEMLSKRELELKSLITHRYSLERLTEAFEIAGKAENCIKVMVEH